MKTTTFLLIRRVPFLLAFTLILSACGARSTNEYGIAPSTGFLLVGERLTGLRVAVGDSYSKTIGADDVTRTLGTWTARRNKDEKMQRVMISVSSGQHDLRVFKDGVLILEQKLYLSEGQSLEVAVPAR